MHFASDNWAGAAPEIADALSKHASGFAASYGTSELDQALEIKFNELFEREVAVFFVGTGTIANSLSLAALNRPGGFVLCHREAHLIEDECGAPEFFTSGGRLVPIDGPVAKMDAANLRSELVRVANASVHHGQPMAVSITQATEAGGVYTLDEIAEISQIAHNSGVPLHMDGARFANAMVELDASPAEMTWKQGVDVLSFGGTKNGCWCAEAIIFFEPAKAEQLPYIRKRAGQLFSKSRFIAAQFHAYLDNELWIGLARHANSVASRLRDRIDATPRIRQAWETKANMVFAIVKQSDVKLLEQTGSGLGTHLIPHGCGGLLAKGEGLYRLVTSFASTNEDVDDFISEVEKLP